MFKKIVCLGLSLALVFSLSACGNNGGGGTEGGKTSESASEGWKDVLAGMPKELKGTEITVYSWNDANEVTDAQSVIDSFTAETGIKVKWVKGTYDNYATEIAAAVASKTAPDVIRLKNLNPGLMSVLQPFENTGFDLNNSAWDKNVKDFYTINGKTYGLNMANTLVQQPKVLIYNRNLISKYELEDPFALWKKGEWTYDKFIEVCEGFVEEAPSDEQAWSTTNFADICSMMGAGTVLYKDGKFVSNTSDPNLVKGWQMMAGLREDGIVGSNIHEEARFGQGKVLFFASGAIHVRKTNAYWPELRSQNALASVPMPQISKDYYLQEFTEYEAYGIPQTAKNAKAVPYFLYYYLNGENYNRDTFFVDPNSLEVYDWCMKQEKNYIDCGNTVLTEDTGLTYMVYTHTLKSVKENQMSTKINSYASVIEAAVASTNSRLSKIK